MSSNRTLMLDNRANVSKETVGLVKISGQNINVFEISADVQVGRIKLHSIT